MKLPNLSLALEIEIEVLSHPCLNISVADFDAFVAVMACHSPLPDASLERVASHSQIIFASCGAVVAAHLS